jgi:hypothetical protein
MVDPRFDPASRVVQLRVVAGRADRGVLVLVAGAQPVSVGTQADWVIVADGVSPVHFYVAFDGTQVFLTPASPRETVLVGGLPIGAGWTAASIPADLHFAGARVALEAAPQRVSLSAPAPMSAMTTVSDNGALLQEARRVLEIELAAAANKPPAPFGGAPIDHTREYPSGASDAPVDRRFEATLSVVPRPGGPGMPVETPRQATQTAYGGIQLVPSLVPPAAPPVIPSAPPTLTDLSDQAPSTLDGEIVRPPRGPWGRASLATKASIVLFPLAVASGAYLYGARQLEVANPPSMPAPVPSRPEAPPTAVLTAVKTPGSLSTTPPAPPVSAAQPARKPSGPQARALPVLAKPGGKTAERAALDAVAEGSFADAAKAYDDLAAQRPEDPDFREASRVLREKAARSH